jgi:hypothetical protein
MINHPNRGMLISRRPVQSTLYTLRQQLSFLLFTEGPRRERSQPALLRTPTLGRLAIMLAPPRPLPVPLAGPSTSPSLSGATPSTSASVSASISISAVSSSTSPPSPRIPAFLQRILTHRASQPISPVSGPSSTVPAVPQPLYLPPPAMPDVEDDLVPPENFAVVCPGVYRCGFPKKRNFRFMETLQLKTVL